MAPQDWTDPIIPSVIRQQRFSDGLLDRFTRNLRVMLDAFHLFSQHNVTYVSITQDIDYSTPEGRLFMTMLVAFAKYFSDALSGHTKKGMRERAMQGMFNGEPPFGYERCDATCIGIDENHTGCHSDPLAGPQMVEMFAKYAGGSHSFRTLGDVLNSRGFRTKGKSRPDRDFGDDPESRADQEGALFTGWAVRDLLKNRFFIAEVRHHDQYFRGRHRPLISETLFNEVQERMKENRSRKSVSVSRIAKNPRRAAIQGKLERTQELYPEGDLSKERYLVIKENAEAELASVYVPESDDAVEAVRILNELGDLWKASNPGQRNRLLLAIFHSIYVDLESREVVGLRPRQAFAALLRATEDCEDVEIWATPYGEFRRDGGDGGESHSPSRSSPNRMCYKLVRRFNLAGSGSRRQDSGSASR